MRSLAEHLSNPELGSPPEHLPDPVEGCAGGSCGVIARFWLSVDERGVITACTARVRGRAAAFAAASALCEAARDVTVIHAASLGLASGLHADFADLDAEDRDRAMVVEDAFHHALGQWLLRRMRATRHSSTTSPVEWESPAACIVGMSGGVDSAVALHRMLERTDGAVVGATLRLWIDPDAPDPDSACCSPDSVRRARATCHAAGVGHLSIDLRTAFARAVVEPFVASYAAGQTPNPCVLCNGGFRMHELIDLATALGAGSVATGHYVRAVPVAGRTLLRRAADSSKDQSYMLSRLEPSLIARMEFPLGEDTKPDVRAEAARRGLEQATISDSQEVCFLGGGGYRPFLARANALGMPGDIVLVSGEVVGRHDGLARFTPGQRQGVAAAIDQRAVARAGITEALYVVDVSSRSGAVTIGSRDHLQTAAIPTRAAQHWLDAPPERARVQLRHGARDGGQWAALEWGADGAMTVRFDEPTGIAAAGQTACLYDESGTVIGAATIAAPSAP